MPRGANRFMHLLAPVIAAVPAIIAYAVIPFGGSYAYGDKTVNLVVADVDWGVLYIFAIGSIAAYGTATGRCSAACARRRRSSPTK